MHVNRLCSCQVQKLEEEKQTLHQLTTEQTGRVEVTPAQLTVDPAVRLQFFHTPPFLQESQQEVLRLQEGLAQLHQEASDRSTQIQGLQGQLERERQERTAEVQKLTEEFQLESQVTSIPDAFRVQDRLELFTGTIGSSSLLFFGPSPLLSVPL